MSERKVLNKYYPPDFDPSKIPKLKLPKDRQYVVRLMAPFNMRCKTCGEYIYKGKKFNARKETVQNESYLGLPIFRTKDSKLEMEVLENLQELKELNQRQANVDFESMLHQYKEFEEQQKQRELEEDEQEMKSMLEQAQSRRLLEDSDSEEDLPPVHSKPFAKGKPTDILQQDSEPRAKKSKLESWERSVGKLSVKTQLSGLVTAKKKPISGMANGSGSQEATSESGGREQHGLGASTANLPNSNTGITSLGLLGAYSDSDDSKSD
ncbi:putative Coiled-coil domain-containing protein [Naja naja]|nr:putative Coiled-coil domain-containing protein [Naja naja]